MARTNYSFERHQRDMAKKKKREEKAKKRAERANAQRPAGAEEPTGQVVEGAGEPSPASES